MDKVENTQPTDKSSEDLYFGILSPIGSNKDGVISKVSKIISQNFGYLVEHIRLSKSIENTFPDVFKTGSTHCKFCEKRNKILHGTKLRKVSDDPAILSKLAVLQIRNLKGENAIAKRTNGKRRIFIFDQLKRREEIDYLSNLFGKSFFLIGVHSPLEQRTKSLAREIGRPESFAQELIELDQSEKEYFNSMSVCSNCRPNTQHSPLSDDESTDYGQQLRDIFAESDLFVSDQDNEEELTRFIDLIFGSPKEFPSASEHAMFMAFSASTRSADLSRQVGAAIINNHGDLISVGSNDVPRAGGGIYDRDNHKNDLALGFEANSKRLNEIASNVAQILIDKKMLDPTLSGIKQDAIKALMEDSDLGSLTEFHRAVHAEMQAIMSAARSGISTKGGSIFVTTFPCHNCAKHIVSSGIQNVHFVEPYPKSLAEHLHQDALVVIEDGSTVLEKVNVKPFLGIGPRRFNDLFSLKLSTGTDIRRKAGYTARDFNRSTVSMRFASILSSTVIETEAETIFLKETKKKLEALKATTKKTTYHDDSLVLLEKLGS